MTSDQLQARMRAIDKRISKFLGSFVQFYKEGHTHRDINGLAINLLEGLRTLTITEEQGELPMPRRTCQTCRHGHVIATSPVCATCVGDRNWEAHDGSNS